MTPAEVRTLTNKFSTLDITEVDDSKRLTLSYMLGTEPWTWDSFPSLYYHSKERPRPRFSYGITASVEEIEDFALRLRPDKAIRFKEVPHECWIVISHRFRTVCKPTRWLGITFEGVYSKKAAYMFSLANSHQKINVEHLADMEQKLLSELREVGWGDKTLKWYISDEHFNDLDREDWSDPTSVVEH